MKRTLIMLLIAACIGVTWYVVKTTRHLPAQVKAQAEAALLADALFPARPVWWQDDKILALGVVPDQVSSGEAAAARACRLLQGLPVAGLRVEVYDVLKIQHEDDWRLLGFAVCE